MTDDASDRLTRRSASVRPVKSIYDQTPPTGVIHGFEVLQSISGTLSNNSVWGTYWYGGASGTGADWRCVQAGNTDPSGNCAGNNSVVAPSAALTFVAPPQDLRPMGNSIAGVAITGLALGAPYDVDMNGVQRTKWTRGAYEYGTALPPTRPAPPTNLRVVP